MTRTYLPLALFFATPLFLATSVDDSIQADETRPHAVFVIGTGHYSPGSTLPGLAEQLETSGFRTTVVRPAGDPERNPIGIGGLEALREADVAIFFMRFLTLPDDQLKLVIDYVKSGKPVVGFRTSSHAFAYPADSKHAIWNDGFGRDVLGSKYFIHLQGSTQVAATELGKVHPILTGVDLSKPRTAAGTLYFSELPDDATVLLRGTGASKKTGVVTNAFGTHTLAATMTDDVAWTWTNKYGGRVFTTTLGHSATFSDPQFVRLFINGIHWAAGKDVPAADTKFVAISMEATQSKPKSGPKTRKKSKTNTKRKTKAKPDANKPDAKNKVTGKQDPPEDPDYRQYGIYKNTAPRAAEAAALVTALPLKLRAAARIALVGNSLFERSQHFGHFETLIQQRYPSHKLVVRNLSWAADTPDIQPRPANFADLDQHLTHEQVDVIFAAYGFNESFAGDAGVDDFRQVLIQRVQMLKGKAFNGKSAANVVLVSPIANENVTGVPASDRNNANLKKYTDVIREVAAEQKVGFVDVFTPSLRVMQSPGTKLTFNGVHLVGSGYDFFAKQLYQAVFGDEAPQVNEAIRAVVVDKNRQYFRRFRPANTFYYTGGRSKTYGYLDFLPAMKNFDIMVANREQRIWALASGQKVVGEIDDSNLPPLPKTKEGRGANRWITAKEELAEFKIDPRFDVALFAGEEEFPDIAAPIQMRWDSRGRLWVACSTSYPHVYPGNEANDKLVILEDTDGDGKADKSSVFADDLHIPLSFEFGDGGVYVSEMPELTFIKDTDGDGKADFRRRVLSGFGTEDSHHALHDFAWTPDGDLIFRESVFHHSQIETPYGPVRQQNSGWFRFQPRDQKLISFGTYSSTNPWGVTFDDWGQHVASHPIYAAAFHALDPPYPLQHPKPNGLRAYSGTCGQEFVDFKTFPDELQGGYIKARYKPTNRIEIHKWIESESGYDEEYVSDLIFSSNLSFIPVDIRYGPRGAMYVCDWYNPVKGHAQYSLRDERRDRHSGRIWRITAKGKPLQDPPKIYDASNAELLDILKRPEYRYRYWAKREIRERDANEFKKSLDAWVDTLSRSDPRFRHHQTEAIWTYRSINALNVELLLDLIACDDHHARGAAVQQLRYWHTDLPDAIKLLNRAANDSNGVVRMEAAIAASYIGSKEALDAILDVFKHPNEKHVAYGITCALGAHTLRRHWEGVDEYDIAKLMRKAARMSKLKEPSPNASQAQFDSQKGLQTVKISCLPERMKFTLEQFTATTGQPIKIVFMNPDATDHNLVVVKPGALAEVGMAANEMAKDPKFANSDFIPKEKEHLIIEASPMIGPTRKSQVHVLRFMAPAKPGIYPFVCTFPGHWVIMKGEIIVAEDLNDVPAMLAARKPTIVKKWTLADLKDLPAANGEEKSVMRGMQAFVKSRCDQCHVVKGHGTNLGPDLTEVAKRYKGQKIVQQILSPSSEINKNFQTYQFLLLNGKAINGVVVKEEPDEYHLLTNLLAPALVTIIAKKDVDEKIASKISSMPAGMVDVLTKDEIGDLVNFLESGGYHLPGHLEHKHNHN
ncbi:MAG: putative heme-binding domain-containing protein [Pirellulaceae bacterium]